jgi:hypothetical protein
VRLNRLNSGDEQKQIELLDSLSSKICAILLIQHLERCKGIILAFPFLVQVEKNELCDKKQRLKAGKENLEEQVKAMNAQPSSLPHPSAMLGTFSAQADAFHWLSQDSQHGNSWHLL